MKIISTNLGQRRKIEWKGKQLETGIYKYPTDQAIVLGTEDVQGDHVIERRFHGGVNKACYCYSADHYPYWKERYPNLTWNWGMFGENLTIEGLDESQIKLGDIYQLGKAKIQIAKPREPCYKLGVRFGTQKMLKEFLAAPYPGTYLRVLEEGAVTVGDELKLLERNENHVTTLEVYQLLYGKSADPEVVKRALNTDTLTGNQRDTIVKKWASPSEL